MADIVRYQGIPALYEEEQNQIAPVQQTPIAPYVQPGPLQQDGLTVIPGDRRLLSPPLVTSFKKLINAAVALGHISLTREQADSIGRKELACLRVSFDGNETLTVEAANRAEHGSASMKAKARQPSGGWAVLVPAETFSRTLAALSVQPLEIAPGERLYLGSLSVQILDGEFPARPPVADDVNDSSELKTVSFQAIISRNDLVSTYRFCSPVIDLERTHQSNLQYLVFSPDLKLAAGTDSKRGRILRLDLRSRARLQHPVPFHLTISAARAAITLDPQEYIFLSIINGELVVGGRRYQDYAITISSRIQTGIPTEIFEFWPTEIHNSFTINRQQVIDFCTRSIEMFGDDKEEGVVSIYFGETIFRMRSMARDADTAREDLDWEIPIIQTKQTSMGERSMFFRPDWLMQAAMAADGPTLTVLLQKNANKKDHITIYGEDTTKVSILMPINSQELEDEYGEE